MESFLDEAQRLSGIGLAPGTPELIEELETAAGNSLPSSLREFLRRAGGSSSAIFSNAVAAATYYGGAEFYEIHELISMQSRLVADGALAREVGEPFFVVGGITGPGSAIVLIGNDNDPPVLHVEGSNKQPVLGSGSLVGETFTGYLDSLLLSDEMRQVSQTRSSALLDFGLERTLADEDVPGVLAEFDLMLERLCDHQLQVHGDHRRVGLRNVIGMDHDWIRTARGERNLSVSPRSVSTLWDGLLLICLGTSLTHVLGGQVIDTIGLLGEVSGSRYSATDAATKLVERYRVDGDIDALVLAFRDVLEKSQ